MYSNITSIAAIGLCCLCLLLILLCHGEEGYRYLDHTQTKVDGLFTDGQSLWFNGPYWYKYDEPLIGSIGQGPEFTRLFVFGKSLVTSKEYLASHSEK